MASRPEHVYLTQAYAGHYARHAVEHGTSEKLALLRIDTSKLQTCRLYADEDALEQCNRTRDVERGHFGDIKERTAFYRDAWPTLDVAKNWQGSLDLLGNCSHHGPIPPDAITGVALVAPASAMCWACDPLISVINYKILGRYYRALSHFPWDGQQAIDREYDKADETSATYLDRLRVMPRDGMLVFERPRDSNAKIITAADQPLKRRAA
jgi:hypothetical protein